MNFNDVATLSIKGSDYRIHFYYMSNDDAINIINNSNLNKKLDCYNFFLIIHKKWVKKFIIRETEKQ